MNYRVLAKIRGDNIWCLRAVPHNVADRPRVNRNESQDAFVELSGVQLKPSELYETLRVFGLSGSEVERFRECSTEDDLLEAAAEVSPQISDFALDLYGSSGLAIPKARYRSFHRDETFDNTILNPDSSDWVLYLHPSQEFIVELPLLSRAAVVGSAGIRLPFEKRELLIRSFESRNYHTFLKQAHRLRVREGIETHIEEAIAAIYQRRPEEAASWRKKFSRRPGEP